MAQATGHRHSRAGVAFTHMLPLLLGYLFGVREPSVSFWLLPTLMDLRISLAFRASLPLADTVRSHGDFQ